MSPPDEVLLSSDTPIDLTHPTASSMKDYVDWYVNVFMSKEQPALWVCSCVVIGTRGLVIALDLF